MSSGFERIQHNNWDIYIAASFAKDGLLDGLLEEQENRPQEFESLPLPSSQRSHIHKFNISIDGNSRNVYVKEYLFKSILHFIKCIFFSGTPAKKAFRAEAMLAQNGFDVAKVVAMGEYRKGILKTKNFLASLEIENAIPLLRHILKIKEITNTQQLADWRKFIYDFGKVIGKMHSKGIFHGDLRLGNILVRQDDNNWRFFFIDNERTRKFGLLPVTLRIKNLVQLNMGPLGIISRTDRMRFFKAYLAENPMSNTFAKIIAKAALRKTSKRLNPKNRIRSRLGGAFKTNYRYLRIKTNDLSASFLRSFCKASEPADFLTKIDNLKEKGQVLKDNKNFLTCLLKWNGNDVIIHHYKHRGLILSILHTLGKSPAKQGWLDGIRQSMLNTSAPQPLAFIERHKSGLVWESYIVSQFSKSQG